MTDTTRNLYQRLAAITGAVGSIRATGRTAQQQPTISIADVEDALRGLLAEHGVVTGYRWNTLPTIVHAGEKVTTWQADLTVWLVNADKPDDAREDRITDIGTSPSAAVSFALKRYYRALFHLADESDEGADVRASSAARTGRREEARSVGAARVKSEAPVGPAPTEPSSGPAAPASDRIARTQALTRLTIAVDGSGLDKLALREKAQAMFGKSKVDEMTADELDGLAAEVEALRRSTGVPV